MILTFVRTVIVAAFDCRRQIALHLLRLD